MNRREFGARLLGSAFAGRMAALADLERLTQTAGIDGGRLNSRLTALSKFGANPQGGVSRIAYSDFDKEARTVVVGWMRDAGLTPSVDFAGNIIGRRAGSDASLKPLIFGSHIDS